MCVCVWDGGFTDQCIFTTCSAVKSKFTKSTQIAMKINNKNKNETTVTVLIQLCVPNQMFEANTAEYDQ